MHVSIFNCVEHVSITFHTSARKPENKRQENRKTEENKKQTKPYIVPKYHSSNANLQSKLTYLKLK